MGNDWLKVRCIVTKLNEFSFIRRKKQKRLTETQQSKTKHRNVALFNVLTITTANPKSQYPFLFSLKSLNDVIVA